MQAEFEAQELLRQQVETLNSELQNADNATEELQALRAQLDEEKERHEQQTQEKDQVLEFVSEEISKIRD